MSTRPVKAKNAKAFHSLPDGQQVPKWETVPSNRQSLLELAVEAYTVTTMLERVEARLLNSDDAPGLFPDDD